MSVHPTIYRQDYAPPGMTITHIDLRINIHADHTVVTSTLEYADHVANTDMVLDGVSLALVDLQLNGDSLAASGYEYDGQRLRLSAMPASGTLQSVVKIFPDQNTALSGFYRSGGMLTTQCEAEGFRHITFFPDRPDVLSTYQVRLEADKIEYPILLSNGNCVDTGELPEGRHFVVWQDPIPKPCYIFAMVAGDLSLHQDQFTTKSGRNITLEIYTEPHNRDKTSFAMSSLKNAMKWDEERFGFEYDLDIFMIVAVDHFNMGAMENKGLNIFNTQCVLASPSTATDSEFRRVESVVGHEYFHNWTGNRITCRSWFELSLKEGLTVFRDQEFSADMGARDIQRIMDVDRLWEIQFAEDASPFAHPVRPDAYQEINNFYTPTVYEKGAEVVRLLHTRLGEAGFQRGMQLYVERHDGQAVTCNDFVDAMADANDVDLSAYLIWYSQAGTPMINAESTFDAAANSVTLQLSQHIPATPGQSEKSPMPIPVNFAVFAQDGSPLSFRIDDAADPMDQGQLMLSEASQHWTLAFDHALDQAPVLSLLRGYSAPVKLNFDQSVADRCLLLAHESDAFSRWAAAQSIFLEMIMAQHEAFRSGESTSQITTSSDWQALISALATLLAQADQNPELIAKILDVPDYTVLITELASVDIEALIRARREMINGIAAALADEFAQVYQQMAAADDGDYARAPQRALKNVALRYWAIHSEEARQIAVKQIHQASNMTDELGGLQTLITANVIAPSEELVTRLTDELQQYYDRWSTDSQVVEKWLALSSASFSETLGIDQMTSLLEHPEFDLNNPNRVRNVVGGFVRNVPLFHRRDGAGYRQVVEVIEQLDKHNPQMGAGLCRSFSAWRKLDADRQALIETLLTDLRSRVNSPNVTEWLDRLLS